MKNRLRHFLCAMAAVFMLTGIAGISVMPVHAELSAKAQTTAQKISQLVADYGGTNPRKKIDDDAYDKIMSVSKDWDSLSRSEKGSLRPFEDKMRDIKAKAKSYDTDKNHTKDGDTPESARETAGKPENAETTAKKERNEDEENDNAAKKDNYNQKYGWKGNIVKNLYGAKFTLFGIKFNFFDLTTSIRKMLLFNGDGITDYSIDNKGIKSMDTKSGVSIYGFAKVVNSGIASFAVFILIAMFFMELFETTIREAERISWERVMFIFIKLYFWRTIAAESYSLMTGILNSGDWIFGVILGKSGDYFWKGKAASSFNVPDLLAKTVDSMGVVQGIVSIVVCVLMFMMLIGSATSVFVPVITRAFKIIAYVSFAPVPIAMCANEQTSHTGKRFIMNFFAVCLEAAMILLMTLLYEAGLFSLLGSMKLGSSANLGTLINAILGLTVMNAVLAGAINLSSQLSREIIGM